MKTLEQVLEYKSETLDGRDLTRLADFIPEEHLEKLGIGIKDEYKGQHKHIDLTKENILERLESDLEFGFTKALNQRGLSAGAMCEVVKMWNWILEEGLENFDDYAMYGLPVFKATAIKYGFPNPIGDDEGSEEKYNN